MSDIAPRLADAKRALDAADRAKTDGQALVDEGRQLARQGTKRIRAADSQYWTAAALVFGELSQSPVTQAQAAEMLGRSQSYVSKLYSIGKTFRGRDPQAEGLSFDAAYRAAQEISDFGIGREKIQRALAASGPAPTQAQLEQRTGLAHSTISEHLSAMVRQGAVCRGPGRPARYELAPAPMSPIPAESPANASSPEPKPELSRPELSDVEGRHRLDVEEILRFIEGRVHREIAEQRLVLTAGERRTLIAEMSATIATLREQSQITILEPEQAPDGGLVSAALHDLAIPDGTHAYFTDGATVWVVVAGVDCAIIRERNDLITAYPSDVTAGWLLYRAVSHNTAHHPA